MSEQVVIAEARLRYINHLYQPSRYQNDPSQNLKYSAAVLIDKNSTSGQAIKAAYDREVMNFHGAPQLAYGQTPCLLDAALKFPGDPFYANFYFLALNRSADDGAPQVLLNPTTPVVDRGEIYPGCWVAVSGQIYGYKGGRGGVNMDLFGIMKIRDDERIGDAAPDAGNTFANAGIQGTGPSIAQPQQAPAGFGMAPPQGVNPPNMVPGISYPTPGQQQQPVQQQQQQQQYRPTVGPNANPFA